jgi:hypothetical protein
MVPTENLTFLNFSLEKNQLGIGFQKTHKISGYLQNSVGEPTPEPRSRN